MRQSMNHTEVRMWACLSGRKLDGWKFRRQHPIGPFYVDFYCPAARLVIEVNGPAHDSDARWAYDRRRQAWLEAEGYRVLRVIVEDIDDDIDEVMGSIYGELLERERCGFRKRPHPPAAPGTSPPSGED